MNIALGWQKIEEDVLLNGVAGVSVYAGTKVTTYSLHPGSIRTELTRHVSIITDYALGRALYYVLSWPLVKEPWNGAQTSICCAVDPALATESGKYYR